MAVLSPYAFATETEVAAFFGVTITDRIREACNRALGEMRTATGRHLAARVWREPVTLDACATVVSGQKVTRASGLSVLRALDDVVGATEVGVGNRVATVTGDAEIALEKAPTAGTGLTLTFGSEPLVATGYGSSVLQAPEYPVHAVYAVRQRLADGTSETVDITTLRIEKATGRLTIGSGLWLADTDYEIDCMAGYRAPSALVRGDPEDWSALQKAFLRLAQVLHQDEAGAKGRKVTTAIGPSSVTIEGWRMPDDIADTLKGYARMWG